MSFKKSAFHFVKQSSDCFLKTEKYLWELTCENESTSWSPLYEFRKISVSFRKLLLVF